MYQLPSNPNVGDLNVYNRPARVIIAQNMRTGEYVEVIAWYHYEVSDLKIPGNYSRIIDKSDAEYYGYI
ncbi:hypothetical protein Lepto7375DRAFT_7279 [Leptolyngbya sp. PCC 7375]|nr:hypothetical protein Lepto7375DRAFT_7279 [Leptolyngbya sp. PCC 7375]